jgi:hypothetical protein
MAWRHAQLTWACCLVALDHSVAKGSYQTGVKLLEAMRDYCEDLTRCRHDILLEYFADG